MITFNDYDLKIADKQTVIAKWKNIWRLGVIAFSRPEDKVFNEVILPSLSYLNDYTNDKVHFYFVGYTNIKGIYNKKVSFDFFNDCDSWYFSNKSFIRVFEKFERFTNNKWKYSGASDLLIVPYRIRYRKFYIDPVKAIDIKLSKIALQNKNCMPEEIIQMIARELKAGKNIDGVSNSRIMDSVKLGLKDSLQIIAPVGISAFFNSLEPFAVRNLKP